MKRSKTLRVSKEASFTQLQQGPISSSSVGFSGATEFDERKPEFYKCSGNFTRDFNELCLRAGIERPPIIVPRKRKIGSSNVDDRDVPNPIGGRLPARKFGTVQKVEKENLTVEKERRKQSPSGAQSGVEREPKSARGLEPKDYPTAQEEWNPKTFAIKSKEQSRPCLQVEADYFGADSRDRDKVHEDGSVAVMAAALTEIHCTGWRVDLLIATAFKFSLPHLDNLNTLSLFDVGLKGPVVHLLSEFLPSCGNLKYLILDGNSQNSDENWAKLLSEGSSVAHLSLRHCAVTDRGAIAIGETLRQLQMSSKLISLNLASNRIGDAGAASIFEGLRLNRVLVALDVSGNELADAALVPLAELVTRFALTHAEAVQRRAMLSQRKQTTISRDQKGSPVEGRPRRAHSEVRASASTRDARAGKEQPQSTRASRKKPSEVDIDENEEVYNVRSRQMNVTNCKSTGFRSCQVSMAADEAPAIRGRGARDRSLPGKDTGGGKKEKSSQLPKRSDPTRLDRSKQSGAVASPVPGRSQSPSALAADSENADAASAGADTQLQHPLLEDADYMVFRSPFRALDDDEAESESTEAAAELRTPRMVMRGNWALACVNLARNRITERGLETLLQALKLQRWMRAHMSTQQTEREREQPTAATAQPGLMRLLLNKNAFDAAQSAIFAEMMEILTARDPLQGDREHMGTARSGTGTSGRELILSAK